MLFLHLLSGRDWMILSGCVPFLFMKLCPENVPNEYKNRWTKTKCPENVPSILGYLRVIKGKKNPHKIKVFVDFTRVFDE